MKKGPQGSLFKVSDGVVSSGTGQRIARIRHFRVADQFAPFIVAPSTVPV